MNIEKMEILRNVRSALSEGLDVEKKRIKSYANLEKLGADYLNMYEIAIKLERRLKLDSNGFYNKALGPNSKVKDVYVFALTHAYFGNSQ